MIPPHFSNIHVEYMFKVDEFHKETFKTKSVALSLYRSKMKPQFQSSTLNRSIALVSLLNHSSDI